MGSGAQTAAETAALPGRRRARRWASCTVRLYRPFPAADAARRAAGHGAPGRRAGPDQGAGVAGRAAVPGRARRAGRSARGWRAGQHAAWSPAAGTGCPPRSSPPAWWPASSPTWPPRTPSRGSPSASTTTSAGTSLAYDRRSTSSRPARSARCSSASARTARSARTRTPSRSSARTRGLHAQGYFVYDSKKSGSQTVSHLRFGPDPIRAPYLSQSGQLRRLPPGRADRAGRRAGPGRARRDAAAQHAAPAEEVWDSLPRPVQEQILAKQHRAVRDRRQPRWPATAGLPGRINTVLQTCFFAISGVLPRDEAIAAIKAAIAKTYGRRGAGGRGAQQRRGGPGPGRAAPGPGPGPGDRQPRAARAGARAARPSSCAGSPPR